MIGISAASSSGGRLKLSVDSSHRVTTSTPTSSHHSSRRSMLSAPARVPDGGAGAGRARPAPVAVDDDADVPRDGASGVRDAASRRS